MKLAAYTLSASLIAGAAAAGGYTAPVVEAPVAPVVVEAAGTDWTGFYAGLQYGQGDLSAPGFASQDFDAFGVHAGYLRDFGRYVAGAELDYNNVEPDLAGAADGDLWRLRGRLGYDLGRFLPYVTLGLARFEVANTSESGMTYGIGADYLVTDRISLGLEYSRSTFDDVTGATGVDADLDLVQIRGSYRF